MRRKEYASQGETEIEVLSGGSGGEAVQCSEWVMEVSNAMRCREWLL